MSKKLKYTRPLTRREAKKLQAETAAREARAQAHARWQAEQLAHYAEQARQVQTPDERRALCREVWAGRHSLPQAVDTVSRILKERDAATRA